MDLFPTSSWDVDYACENLNKQLFGSPPDKKIRKSMEKIVKINQNKSTAINSTPNDAMRKDLLNELKGRFENKRKLECFEGADNTTLLSPNVKKVKKKVQFKPEEENSMHIYTPRPKTLKKIKITKGSKLILQAKAEPTKKQHKFSLLMLANVRKQREPTAADSGLGESTPNTSTFEIKSKKKKKEKKAKTVQKEILASQQEKLEKKKSLKKQKLKTTKKNDTDTSPNNTVSPNIIEHPVITKKMQNYVEHIVSQVQNESIQQTIKVVSPSEAQNKPGWQHPGAEGGTRNQAEAVVPRRRQPGSLRERMLRKLQASRFRYLNEQMYCSKGNEAMDYFKKDPSAFQAYHKGYRQQVAQWPLNPVDKIINVLRKKSPNLVIADFGCGDAKIARSLPNTVHSFDLVAISDHVTACDMAHTPLANNSVDIAVFCLSLMGTNIADYLSEANRVLKSGGILKIAEVESRFENVDAFIKSLQKYGFTLTNKDLSNNLFYFMDLQKVRGTKKQSKSSQSEVALKPCLYKKR